MHEQNSHGLMGTSAVFLTKKSDRKIWAMLLIGLVFTELCRESNAHIFLSYSEGIISSTKSIFSTKESIETEVSV